MTFHLKLKILVKKTIQIDLKDFELITNYIKKIPPHQIYKKKEGAVPDN